MPKKIQSVSESPGEARPISLSVSLPEVLALMKWHASEARKLKNRGGKVVMENPFGARDLRSLMKVVKEGLDHHKARIHGLAAIARELIEKKPSA